MNQIRRLREQGLSFEESRARVNNDEQAAHNPLHDVRGLAA
jgi:hypothetical protein